MVRNREELYDLIRDPNRDVSDNWQQFCTSEDDLDGLSTEQLFINIGRASSGGPADTLKGLQDSPLVWEKVLDYLTRKGEDTTNRRVFHHFFISEAMSF